jgi:hypothetical protein
MTRSWIVLCGGVVGLLPLSARAAEPAADALLPSTVVFFAATPDAPKLFEAWDQTQFHQLLKEPALKPFLDELAKVGPMSGPSAVLGLTAEELRKIAGGEAAFGLIPRGPGAASTVLLINTAGRGPALKALLKQAEKGVQARKGQVAGRKVGTIDVTTYTLPGQGGGKPQEAVVVSEADRLIVTDDARVLDDILERWKKKPGSDLAGAREYQWILARTAREPVKPAHLVWYLNPFGLIDATRAPLPESKKKRDRIEMMREEGFTAVRAVGGQIWFHEGAFDVLHRTAIYAPGPYKGAMRMIAPVNGRAAPPEPWVPANVTGYVSGEWDLVKAFDSVGSLFDRETGKPGEFEDILKATKEDPDGPRVDIRKDVVGTFTGRFVRIFDSAGAKSNWRERTLTVFATRDEKGLAGNMNELLWGKHVRTEDVHGTKTWRVTPQPKVSAGGKPIEQPDSAFAVVNSALFIADHPGLLEKALAKGTTVPRLAADPDYIRVAKALDTLTDGKVCLRAFFRSDEGIRGSYEAFKGGLAPQGDSFAAGLLRSLVPDTPAGLRQKGATLPDFAKISPHLHPAGTDVVTRDDGWVLVGFVLKPEKR